MTNKTKIPNLSGFLSLIVPGLGQAYNGEYKKALIYFAIPFILWNMGYIFFPSPIAFGRGLFDEYIFATIVAFIIRILSAADAKRIAKEINEGEIKHTELLDKKRIALIALFFVFLILGFTATSSNDYAPKYIAYSVDGEIVAKDSSIGLENYTPAEDDVFAAVREDSSSYYGRWGGGHDAEFVYIMKFRINPDDIKWEITTAGEYDKGYESMVFKDLNENICNFIDNGTNLTVTSDVANQIESDYHYGGDEYSSRAVKLDGGMMEFKGHLETDEPIDFKDDVRFTVYIARYDEIDNMTDRYITFNVTIPKDNIDVPNLDDVKLEREYDYSHVRTTY